MTYVQPPVFMDEITAEVLYGLASSAPADCRQTADRLLEEIWRATILPANQLPRDIVRLGSDVTYQDLGTGRTSRNTVVLPVGADISKGRVSVLSPVGAGLIGLAQNSVIRWPLGRRHSELKVLAVSGFSPEALCG
jgi:regulator of nucleoside diphosphate kinase